MRIVLKVLVFSIVSLATWMLTSSIVAQQQRKPKAPDQSKPEVTSNPTRTDKPLTVIPTNPAAVNFIGGDTKFTISPNRLGAARPQVPLGRSGGFAEGHLRSHSITIEGGLATVAAHVSLADRRHGMSYVWRLRVVDPREKPLAGMVYDQQMFTIEASGQKEVDFQDVVAVPPGARRVELSLFAKASEEDLSFLDDDSKADGHLLIRAVKLLSR